MRDPGSQVTDGPLFAEVALNVPLRAGDRVFTFGIPLALQSRIVPGTPVRVPFGRQTSLGFVVGVAEQADRRVRPIAAVEERLPQLPPDLVALAEWMADYYVCTVGEAVAAMLPSLAAALRKPKADPGGAIQSPGPVPEPAAPTGVVAQLSTAPRSVAVVGEDARFDAYAEALRWAVEGDLGAIVLVPEISQAERMAAWVARHAGAPVALLTGDVPEHQRWADWRRILAGEVRVVVGTRLAVFAPLPRLGLIIVDHEEDSAYKEEREPRYHARRIVEERARVCGASTLWGTPAPSLEVVYSVRTGRATAITLASPARPVVSVSDVRAEAGPLGGLFGRRLYQALARTLPRGRAIMFVPRRGYADFLLCHDCGTVPRCPRCGVALTYHRDRSGPGGGRPGTAARVALRCHLCNRTEPVPEVCPQCQGAQLRPHGIGTERVEQAARKLFRSAPVMRLDAEAAPTEASQLRIWQQFQRRGGILIGTQLLIKGVGQVRAAVVGAVGIDAALNLPDFRAAERVHQVLTRLLRLAEEDMVVQTFSPAHPALVAFAQGDAAKFYEGELGARERFGYPPFRPLVNLIMTGPREDAVRDSADRLASSLAGAGEVLGPSPAPIARVRGRYRWQLLVKEQPEHAARRKLGVLLTEWKLPRDVKLTVDVDPVDLL